MNKLSLTKKILATACAVAGLTFVGGSSEAADVDNQKSVLKPQNTLNIINDMNMRNTNPYFESINVVNSENSQVLKQIRNDKVSIAQDNNLSQTNGVLGLNNNVSARSLNVRNSNNSTITRMGGTLTGAAAELKPTLDDMQKEAKDNAVPNAKTYFGISSPYVLTQGKASNPSYTNISYNGKTYHYATPTNLDSEKAAMLRYLSDSTSIEGALTTDGANDDNSVFSIGGVKYTFATGNLPTSAYALTKDGVTQSNYDIKYNDTLYKFDFKDRTGEITTFGAGTDSDYDFRALKATSDGTISADKYYNITINPNNTSNNKGKIAWSQSAQTGSYEDNYVAGSNVTVDSTAGTVTGAIRLKTSHNGAVPAADSWNKWFTYTYTKPVGYDDDITQTRINNAIAEDGSNVKNQVFAKISGSNNGGAIYNTKNLSSTIAIIADFIGNHTSYGIGGAISNYAYSSSTNKATISSIKGDFTGNYAKNTSSSSKVYGGAISNYSSYSTTSSSGLATISSIEGDFVGNSASSSSSFSYGYGGAISNYASSSYNTAKIHSIEGDFVGNSVSSSSYGYGGAISNNASSSSSSSTYASASAEIDGIVGDFVGNSSTSRSSYGGAISNYAESSSYGNASATIGSILGDFVGNFSTTTDNYQSYGGAISNNATSDSNSSGNVSVKIGSIVGDFVGNSTSTNSYGYGGAISNYAAASSSSSSAVINATIDGIVGDFVGNSSYYGGAISNYAQNNGNVSIGSITGDFVGNSSYGYGGAISNYAFSGGNVSVKIGSINGDFVGNFASASSNYYSTYGGAISNYAYVNSASIGSIVGKFVGNSASASNSGSAYGGAISNYAKSSGTASIGSIVGDFVGNSSSSNYYYSNGGAIYNRADSGTASIGSITGNFVGNYAKTTSSTGKVYGGAIFNGSDSSGTPKFNANAQITLAGNTFTGNYVDKNGTQTPNSIYNAGVINIANGATVTINDGYDGMSQAQLKIGTGASSGSIFNLSVDNGIIQTDNLGTVTNNGTINWDLDVSLTAKNSDKITASFADVEGNNKSIIINAINLVTGTGSGQVDITLTTDSTLKTAYTLSDSILSHITKATGVTYTVNTVDYDSSTGVLTFNKVNDSLALKVHTGDPLERTYTMTAAETVGENLGQLEGGTGAKLDVNGGGFAINGGTYTGITVSEGQTLTFTNVSDVTGFANDTAVTNGGTLEITGSKFTSKIANNASMTLSGTNTLNGAISGTNGQTVISTGITTVGAALSQKDLTVESGAGLNIAANNLNITNAVKNDGTVTLGSGTLGSSITDKTTAATGKTVINGDVTITSGKTVSQAMEVTAGTGHKLSANAASIGGAVTNNADLVIFSHDPITSETTHFNQNVTGSGTTTIQRNVNVDSTIANNVVIDKYVDGSSNKHYANVVVGSTGTLGAAGKTIVINAGDGTNYNTLTIGTGSVAADSIANNSKLVLNNSTSGTLSKAITGSGILNIAATGDNADSTVITTGNTITNQNINVQKGVFKVANASHLAGTTNVNVGDGAVIDTIDNVINDYSSKITLNNGATANADINATAIDQYTAANGSTIAIGSINAINVAEFQDHEFQFVNSGATVTGESIQIASGKTVTVKGSGTNDGKVLVSESTSAVKLNGAVYTSETKNAITYTMSEGETVNHDRPALGYIKDKFEIKSNNTTQKVITADQGGTYSNTKGLIVDTGKELTVDNVKFQDFATGTVTDVDGYNGTYEGIITVKSGATLNVKDSYFAVSDNDGNTKKIAIANYGTLKSDPSIYEGGVMNYKGASFTVTGDTFQNIDRSAYDGGAIYNEAGDPSALPDPIPAGTITMNKVKATNNKAANGGVLYNAGTATINGGTFTDNSATSLGGAIYTSTNLTVKADTTNGNVLFSGNKQNYVDADHYTANDIYMAGGTGDPIALNLNAAATKTITLASGVAGSNYNVNVNDDTAGLVSIAGVKGANTIALKGGELDLTSDTTVTALTASTATTLNASSTNGLNVGTLTVADGGTFTNSGKLTVTSTLTNGTATTYGTIANNGDLTLGAVDSANMTNVGLINGTGNLYIGDGDKVVTLSNAGNNAKINGNAVTINQKALLVTGADDITSNNIANAGTLNLTGASGDGLDFDSTVNGIGKTIITNDTVNLKSGRKINQGINILADNSNNAKLVASADDIGENVTVALNAGGENTDASLTLNGGTIKFNIDGYKPSEEAAKTYGGLTISANTALYTGKNIDVADLIVSGSSTVFTNNSSVTVRDDFTNNGTITNNSATAELNLFDGDSTDPMENAGTINGTGKVNIGAYTSDTDKHVAYVQNTGTGSITGDITIAKESTLKTASDKVTDSNGLTNDGTLIFNNSADGDINQNISGSSETSTGVVEIAAGNDVTVDMNGNTITNNIIKLTSGTLKATGDSDGNVYLTAADKIEANGGTLSVQDGQTGTITLGDVDITTKDLSVKIDADFTTGSRDTDNVFIGSADTLSLASGKSVTGTNKIKISDIKIADISDHSTDPYATEFKAQIADDTIKNSVDLSSTTLKLSGITNEAGDLLISYNDGWINGKHTDLKNAITSSIEQKMFSMSDGDLSGEASDLQLGGTSLSVTTNGNNITGNNSISIVLASGGQTLSITGTNSDPEQPNTTISGFGTAINNTAGGTVILTNVTMSGNTTDVDNSGDNAGAVNLNGVTATNIINDGEGTNGVFLTGTNSINSIVDKDSSSTHGQTTITNGTATITTLKQKGVTVNAGATANLTDITKASTGSDGITNNGDLVIADGDATTPVTNNNTIKSTSTTGHAKTTIAAGSNITNNADITQKEVVVSAGDESTTPATPAAKLTNNSTINADTINVNDSAELNNNSNIAAADGSSTAAINVKSNADLNLNKGSNTKADVTLDAATSDLTITDNGKLSGGVKTSNGGSINLVADDQNISMSSAITDAITGADGTGNGSYKVTATSTPKTAPATPNTVTIDKAIAGATEVDVNADTVAVITDTAYTSTTAPIKVGNNGDLTLENTTTGTTAVGSSISSLAPTDTFDVTINNSDDGTTDINNIISGADTVTGNGGTTNLNSVIIGADSVIAKSGKTNINAGSASSSAARIGNADIEIKSDATAQVTTTSDNFVLTNDVLGTDSTSTLKLSGNAPTDPKSDKNDVGTIFSINPNNTIGSAVEVATGQLNTGDGQNIDGTVTVKGNATLNTMDGTYQSHGDTVFEDNALLKADVSAITGKSDDFTGADEQGTPEYLTDLNIADMNKITEDTKSVDLKNAFGLNNLQATDSLISSLDEKYSDVMTPIRKMKAVIDTSDNNLLLRFTGTGNGYNDFNPAVMVSPIAAQLGGYLSQLNSYDEAFRNLDMKMLMTREERKAFKMANLYASEVQPKVFSPTYLPEKDSAGWFRPYASFEKVNLKGGPNVENVMYGSYFGGDSQMKELRNGWDFQYSVYIGYNGSHQNYQGNSIYQNGGNLGATGIWYKDDFFTALTANVGASVADASTMYGSEDFPMLMTGVASKTGYNWELAKGKFIIQPSWLMSYTFVNTFDYTNAAGVRIKSDPLHAINMAPGVKFIGNLKHGWQPYVSMRMVWNIMDQTDFHANNVSLPELSVKPYFQYGVGLQKRWGDRFTGFLQAMLRSGGRNGIALSAGLRWAIGKDYHSYPDYKQKNKTSNIIKKTTTNNMHDVTTSVESQKVIAKQLDDMSRKVYTTQKPVVKSQNLSTNVNKQVSSVKPKKESYKSTTLTSNSAVVTKL